MYANIIWKKKSWTIEDVDLLNDYAWENRHTNFSFSKEITHKTIQWSKKESHQKGIAYANRFIAHAKLEEGAYAEALELSLNTIEQFDQLNDLSGLSDVLNSLGAVYNYLGDYENRLSCNQKCFELKQKCEDQTGLINALNNIGDTYLCLEQPEKALSCFKEALDFEDLNATSKTILLHNVGEAYYQMGDSKAEDYFLEALQESLLSKYTGITIHSSLFLSKIYAEKTVFEKAIKHIETAFELANNQNSPHNLMEVHLQYASVYEKMEDTVRAYFHLKTYHELNKSLFGKSKIQEIKNVQFGKELALIQKETEAIKTVNAELKIAFNKIDNQNRELAQSISYAHLIQKSLLHSEEVLHSNFDHYFLFHRPKDVLSGDFYWVKKVAGLQFVAVADCTGHGVPAALLSLICSSAIDRIVVDKKVKSPGEILDKVCKLIIKKITEKTGLQDGMDISIFVYNEAKNELDWAGANNPLWIVRDGRIVEFLGDKQPIGKYEKTAPFTTHPIEIKKGDLLCLFSDGFQDQFGGQKEKKFKKNQFKDLMIECSKKSSEEAKKLLELTFNYWKGDVDQTDDVCVLGIKL